MLPVDAADAGLKAAVINPLVVRTQISGCQVHAGGSMDRNLDRAFNEALAKKNLEEVRPPVSQSLTT